MASRLRYQTHNCIHQKYFSVSTKAAEFCSFLDVGKLTQLSQRIATSPHALLNAFIMMSYHTNCA